MWFECGLHFSCFRRLSSPSSVAWSFGFYFYFPPPAHLFHLLSVFSAAIPQRRLRATSASRLPPSSLFLLPSLLPSRSSLLPFIPFSTKSGFAALGKSSYAFHAFFFSKEDRFRVVVDIAWIHLSMCIGVCCGCFPVFQRCWLLGRVSGI